MDRNADKNIKHNENAKYNREMCTKSPNSSIFGPFLALRCQLVTFSFYCSHDFPGFLYFVLDEKILEVVEVDLGIAKACIAFPCLVPGRSGLQEDRTWVHPTKHPDQVISSDGGFKGNALVERF